MRRPSFFLCRLLVGAMLLASASLRGQGAAYTNFESSQTRPVCLSPDGRRLFVVNTPDARLSVFDVSDSAAAAPTLLREIPVGLEPVSVNARTNDEVWVVSQVSGSVSVVSVSTGMIIDTLPCPTEPADVVFASGKAFVSCAGSNAVRVFDLATRQPGAVIAIQGLHPRSLAASADGTKVYAAIASSGNGTTLLPPTLAPAPPSPAIPSLPAAPQVSLIVPATDARLQPRPNLPDNDVAVIDAAAGTVSRYYQRVGTINFAVAVRPGSTELWVANTEARNLVRFETALKGHAVDNRVTRVETASAAVTAFDLNPGIDYSLLPNPAARATALAQPTALAFEPDGASFWIASFGTDRVARVRADDGVVTARVETGPTTDGSANPASKRGPRGLAFQSSTGRLYVANRISNSLTVVATTGGAPRVLAEVPAGSYDPTPNAIRLGRGFLYDARLSGNGTQSCASCHIDGHRDELAWDLGDPGGEFTFVFSTPVGSPFPLDMPMHPMKGPMTTQTLRGLVGMEPLHWRGDRADFTQFNAAFVTLLGGAMLSPADMAAFRDFVNTIVFPANPNQRLDRSAPPTFPPGDPNAGDTAAGQYTYLNEPYTAGQRCNTCHLLPTGSNRTLIPSFALQESQSFKVPQLRDIYSKRFFARSATAVSLSGFGLTHDGVDPDLFAFLSRPVFDTFANDTARKRNLSAFVMCLDSGTAPAVGYARTVRAGTLAAAAADWTTLEAQARARGIDLIARAQFGADNRGLLYRPASGDYASDQASLGPYNRAQLEAMVSAGTLALTLVGVPAGSGPRMALDRTAPAPPATFAAWQSARFTPAELLDPGVSGDHADPDGDGEDNLAEFRAGSDPRSAGSLIRSGRAINLSTRLRAQTGDNVLIGGFVISGTEPKNVIVRALGPSLANAGVAGVLANPTLELFSSSGASLAANNNWRDSQPAEIQAAGLAPGDPRESAIIRILPPGAYTAVVRGADGGTGVSLVEVYDLAPGGASELINVSTRGRVETGDNVMIGGFVVGAGLGVGESGTARVLVRAIAPSLTAAGLTGLLADPTLELRDATGAVVATNDNWADTQRDLIQATGLAPTNTAESALVVILPKGAYTAIIRGKGGATGIALVEVYKLP